MADISNSDDLEDDSEDKDLSSADSSNTKNYSTKLVEMQKYIPFLEVMIAKIEKAKDKSRQAQLVKLRSLYDILNSKKQKLKVESLEKCELVLKKLYEKVDKGDKGLFVDKNDLQADGTAVEKRSLGSENETSSVTEENSFLKIGKTTDSCVNIKEESVGNKPLSIVDSNLKKRSAPFSIKPDKNLTSLKTHKGLSAPDVKNKKPRQLEPTEKQSMESTKKETSSEHNNDKQCFLSNSELTPNCFGINKNCDVSENKSMGLKTDDFSRPSSLGMKSVISATELRKNFNERQTLPSPLHALNNSVQQDASPEVLQKNSNSLNETIQKKPSSLSSVRAKLTEEITTVHKVGTSSGGALRNLVNKAENIKHNRIMSLKPGTVIDLYNEKAHPSVNTSPKPTGLDSSTKGKFELTDPKKSALSECNAASLLKENNLHTSNSTNVLSHLSSEQLEKLVAENLGSLPSPAPETMMKILETISAKEKGKQATTTSHSSLETLSLNQRHAFQSSMVNQMSQQIQTNLIHVSSSPNPNVENNLIRSNISGQMFSAQEVPVPTSHSARIPSLLGIRPHFSGFSPNNTIGSIPGNVRNYCPSPYHIRNDTIRPLLSPNSQQQSGYMSPLINFSDPVVSSEQVFLFGHQPPVVNNQTEQFQPLLSTKNQHYDMYQRRYSGAISIRTSVPSGPRPVSHNSTPSYSRKETNTDKGFNTRDPRRRRSLENTNDDDDDDLYLRRKNFEKPRGDVRKSVENQRDENRKMLDDDNRSRFTKDENSFIENVKRNDPRHRKNQPALSGDARFSDFQNSSEKYYNRSRDPRVSGGDGNSGYDRNHRTYSVDRSLSRDRDRHSGDFDRYKRSHDHLNSGDESYKRLHDSFYNRNVDSDKQEGTWCSPLERLYTGISGPKTGKGYGFQSFRIPKKKKEEPPESVTSKNMVEQGQAENEKTSETCGSKDNLVKCADEVDKSVGEHDDYEASFKSSEEEKFKEEKSLNKGQSIIIKGNKIIDVEEELSDHEKSNLTDIEENSYGVIVKTEVSVESNNNFTGNTNILTGVEPLTYSDAKEPDICVSKETEAAEKNESNEKSVQEKGTVKIDSLTEKIKEEFTQELIGSYLRKSLNSGFCKKLLERLDGAPLKGDKLKKIEKILVSSSDDDDEITDVKSDDKKQLDEKESVLVKHSDLSKKLDIKVEPEDENSCSAEGEVCSSEMKDESVVIQPKNRKGNLKKTKKKKQNLNLKKKKYLKKITKNASSKIGIVKDVKSDCTDVLESETVDNELSSNKPRRKGELEKLHEDIRDMFISASVVNATGVRTCRLKPDPLCVENLTKKCENDPCSNDCSSKTKARLQAKTKRMRKSYQLGDHDSESDDHDDCDDNNSFRKSVKSNKRLLNKNVEKLKVLVSGQSKENNDEMISGSSGKSKKRQINDKKKKNELLNEDTDVSSDGNSSIKDKITKKKSCDSNSTNGSKVSNDKEELNESLCSSRNIKLTLKKSVIAEKPVDKKGGVGNDDESSEDELLTVLREKCLSEKNKSVDDNSNSYSEEKLDNFTISDSGSPKKSDCSLKNLSPLIVLQKTAVNVVESEVIIKEKADEQKVINESEKDKLLNLNKTVIKKKCDVESALGSDKNNEIDFNVGKNITNETVNNVDLRNDSLLSETEDQEIAKQKSVISSLVLGSSECKKLIKKIKRKRWSFGYIKKKLRAEKVDGKVGESLEENSEEPIYKIKSNQYFVNFIDKEYYQDDLIKHLSCKLCCYKNKSAQLVRHYVAEHSDNEVLVSRLSEIVAKESIEAMSMAELSEVESPKKSFHCLLCNRVCSNVLSFYDHVTSHTGEFRFGCNQCNYRASNRDAIKTHCRRIHHQKKLDYKCEHLPDIDITNVYGYICTECNFVQLKSENVEEHISKRHNFSANVVIKKINFSKDSTWKSNSVVINNETDDSSVTSCTKSSDNSYSLKEQDKLSTGCISNCQLGKDISIENMNNVVVSEAQANNTDNCPLTMAAFVPSKNVGELSENIEDQACIMKNVAKELQDIGIKTVICNANLDKLSIKLPQSYENFDTCEKDTKGIFKRPISNIVDNFFCKLNINNGKTNKECSNNFLKKKTVKSENHSNFMFGDSKENIFKDIEVIHVTGQNLKVIDKNSKKDKSGENEFLKVSESSVESESGHKGISDFSQTVVPAERNSDYDKDHKEQELETLNKKKSVSVCNVSLFTSKELPSNDPVGSDSLFCKIKNKNSNNLLSIVGKLSNVIMNDSINLALSNKEVDGGHFTNENTLLDSSMSDKNPSISWNHLSSSSQSAAVKKYKFQDASTTHIQVGHVSASVEDGVMFFTCNADKCGFKATNNADSFLQHVEMCHENFKFQAVCSACFIRCDKSNESHMVSSFLHLLNNHLVLYSENKTINNEELQACAHPSDKGPDIVIKSEIVEPVVNKPVNPPQPLLRVRRLSGDQLSSIPTSGSPTNLSQASTSTVSPDSEVFNFCTSTQEDTMQTLRIESVISLNPTAAEHSDNSKSRTQNLPTSSYMFIPSVGNYLPVTKKVVKISPVKDKSVNPDDLSLTGVQTASFRTQALVSVLSPKKGTSPPTNSGSDSMQQVVVKKTSPPNRKTKKCGPLTLKEMKPPELYAIMTTPKKLCHLFKCMHKTCSFTCQSPKKFEVHCNNHVANGDTNTLLTGLGDWRMCVYCCELYNTPSELSAHIIDKHAHSVYQCAYCFYRAFSLSNVVLHQNMHHINNNIHIFKCVPILKNEDSNKSTPPPPREEVVRTYECAIQFCKLKTYIPGAFEKHLYEHSQLRMCQVCSYCCVKILKAENVLEHYKIHFLNLYQCIFCLHGTDTEEDMRTHLCIHHPDQSPKAVMRVNKNYYKASSYDTDDSPFVTPLNDLKECDFDDQKGVPDCVVSNNVIADDSEEPKTESLLRDMLSTSSSNVNLQLSETTGMLEATPDENEFNEIDISFNPNTISKTYPKKTSSSRIKLFHEECNSFTVGELKRSGSILEEPCSKKSRPNIDLIETPSNQIVSFDSSSEGISLLSTLDMRVPSEDYEPLDQIEMSDVDSEKNKSISSTNTEKNKNQPIVENLFSCGYKGCDFVSLDSDGLRDHFKVCDFQRDTSKNVTCVHCGRTFKRVASLLEHLHSHGIKRFSCSLCSHCDTTEKKAALHMKDYHSVSNINTMSVDPLHTNKDTDLFVVLPVDNKGSKLNLMDLKGKAKKLSYCTNEIDQLPKKEIFGVTIICNHCSYSTKVRKNMAQHLECHETGQSAPSSECVNPMPCLESKEMMFDKMINLAGSTHMKTTKPNVKPIGVGDQRELPKYVPDNARYVCHTAGCTYVTVDDTMLRHHIKALHSEEINYRCPHCKNTGGFEIPIDKLGAHLKLHDTRLYKCAYCVYHHNQRYLVERHVSEKHPEKRPFVQVVRESETDDIKSGDERESSRSCNVYELSGSSSSKPWQCNLCKAKAATEEQIKDHAGSQHGVNCQFKCSLCDFKADAGSAITEHFTAHHPILPVKFISVYSKDEVSFGILDITELNSPSASNSKGTAPLWRKDKKRVRHIRGILLDDQSWKPKQNKNIPVEEMVFKEDGKYGSLGFPAPGCYYVCPRCIKYKTKNKGDMQNHLYRELDYKMWICGYCRKADITRYNITRHLAKSHEGKPELIGVLTPDEEVERWVHGVLKKQNCLMKSKDLTVDDSIVRPKLSSATSSGIRSRRSSVVDEEIKSEDTCKNDGDTFIFRDEIIDNVQSTSSKLFISQTPIKSASKRELERLSSESVDEDLPAKLSRPKKQMLPKRWRCGYCKVTTVQEKSIKTHQANKHPNLRPLVHEIGTTKNQSSPRKTSFPAPLSNLDYSEEEEEEESSDLFECRLCGLVGAMKELYVHNYNAHPHNKQVQVSFKGGKRFHCTESGCNYVSQALSSIRKHFHIKHPSNRISYEVEVIAQPEVVDDNDNPVGRGSASTRRSANKNQEYYCPTCDFSSDVEDEVISHLKSHLLYKCLLCNTVFSSLVAARNHIQQLHGVPPEGNMKPIMSSDLITKNSPPVKVIYTARKSTALGAKNINKRCVARKSTSRLPSSWKSLLKSPAILESDDSLRAKEFSFYGKPKTVENFNNIKTSMVVGNQCMNLTVTQLSKIFDINPKFVIKDLKHELGYS